MLLEARFFAAVGECGDASRGIKLARFPPAMSVIWSRIEEVSETIIAGIRLVQNNN
jgi:hypothetical protein